MFEEFMMAKKVKRQTSKTPTTVATPMVAPAATVVTGSNGAKSVRSFDREFNPDYTPIVQDLRRIGMLAGSFFVILIILSFFLR
jgi:hypothetical protein